MGNPPTVNPLTGNQRTANQSTGNRRHRRGPVAGLWDLCLPHACAVCGRSTRPLCGRCAAELPLAAPRPPPGALERLAGLLDYRDQVRRVVAAAKLRPTGPLADLLGRSLGPLLTGLAAGEPVVVTWAPTVATRARRRGADQAEALARAATQETLASVRIAPTLRRIGRGRQVGRDRIERIDGVRFVAEPGAVPTGARVVVVDDVCTTGATLDAAGAALLAAGAASVDGLVLAVRS